MSTPEAMVYVVDDDPSVRKALARLFRSVGLEVETFETARAFLDHERQDVPGSLVLDVQMPGLSGIELQEELCTNHVDLPIVFLTGHGDIPMTVKAMKAGATDFLPKPVDDERLLDVVSQAIDRHAEDRQKSRALSDFLRSVETLTKREHEVMTHVVKGRLNKQIALEMDITEYTVKVHRGRVMEKTGVESVAELVRLWERSDLSEEEGIIGMTRLHQSVMVFPESMPIIGLGDVESRAKAVCEGKHVVDQARISIVDDDPSVGRALCRLCRSAGYSVSCFESAEAFLEASVADEIDCLILDVHLPGRSGPQLQDELSAAGSPAPIIFITAYEEQRVREKALASGAREFLQKPLDSELILGAIEKALGAGE